MSEEIGKVEKPEAKQYEGKRKLYLVPLLYSFEGAPDDYVTKFNLYWKQVNEHVRNLESKMGTVDLIYHESVTIPGEDGLKLLEKLNPASHEVCDERCRSGARLEVIEDAELTEETMDWERHILMGFISEKVARKVSELFSEASRKRNEHIANRINETLGKEEAAVLFIRESHRVQFPQDIEVFSVAPPALDEIHRWMRERQTAMAEEAAEEEQSTGQEDTPGEENTES